MIIENEDQFIIIKVKSGHLIDLCIQQDVCFLKKGQEPTLYKAFHESLNLWVVLACIETKSYIGFG
jgi:hypothetical protein